MTKDRKKVFLTGGTGLIGAHLIDHFIQMGHTILALKRSSSNMDLVPKVQGLEWVDGDLHATDSLAEYMSDCDVCVHAAGQISVSDKEHSSLDHINAGGTASVINAALESGINRLVHVSSVAALGREEKGVIDESADYEDHPAVTPYGRSKHLADLEAYRGLAEGLSVNIIRPSLVMGSGHWTNGSDSIFVKMFKGVPFYPAGGTGVVDVRDVVRLIQRLMDTTEDGVDIIANGANCTFKNLQARISQIFGKTPPAHMLKDWMITWFVTAEKMVSVLRSQPSIITRQSLRRAQNQYFYNAEKSIEKLDFQYTDLDRTLRDCCEAYLDFLKTGVKQRLSFS